MLRAFWDAARAVDPTAAKLDESHMPLCRSGELGELWKRSGLAKVEERPLDIVAGGRRPALREEVMGRLALKAGDAPFSLPARAWAVRGIVQKER